jgi:DNA-directed RNA polymerase subunit RPC12/RpoP
MSFEKQEHISGPEEVSDPYAPDCPTCNERMWLSRIETKVAAEEITSTREYECSQCHDSRVVVAREPL